MSVEIFARPFLVASLFILASSFHVFMFTLQMPTLQQILQLRVLNYSLLFTSSFLCAWLLRFVSVLDMSVLLVSVFYVSVRLSDFPLVCLPLTPIRTILKHFCKTLRRLSEDITETYHIRTIRSPEIMQAVLRETGNMYHPN